MSREYNLYSSLVGVEKGNREDLLKALKNLGEFDCDFNGENGTEYTWEEALEQGFESNLEYVLNEIKNIENDVDCVEKFISMWMGGDDYYSQYELNYLADDGKIYAISLSATTGY